MPAIIWSAIDGPMTTRAKCMGGIMTPKPSIRVIKMRQKTGPYFLKNLPVRSDFQTKMRAIFLSTFWTVRKKVLWPFGGEFEILLKSIFHILPC